MQLIPEKKAVLLRLRHPEKMHKLIPTSKAVSWKGRRYVAIPHKLEEMRVLSNLGMDAPSPICTYYEWPRHHRISNPFAAQKQTAGFLTLNPRAFVLNDLGTGKSLSALWAFDYLRSKGVAQRLLIVCPLSTMERTWADELFFNMPHLNYKMLYGTPEKRRRLLAEDADVYIINHHGLHTILEDMAVRHDINYVVVDELAQCARNAQTDMWKRLNKIVNKQTVRACWGLTGTPMPNAVTDAYAQVKLIRPERMKRSFTDFRNEVMMQAGPYQWLPRKGAVDAVYKYMQPAIRYARDQCIDLPPTIHMTRQIELTAAQAKAYDSMAKTLCAQVAAGELLAVNEAVKVSKLVQIACGAAYDTAGNTAFIPARLRLREAADLVLASASKTIVFVPFRGALTEVSKYIAKKTGRIVGEIHGGVKKSDRDDIFTKFMHGGCDVIVAQPAAMSHGLTLTSASTIVWFAPPMSADVYEQANGRITRPGQKLTTIVVNIEGTPVERRLYDRLRGKMALQGILLDKNLRISP
jgi:SNF2 family DNA or RNA helicase